MSLFILVASCLLLGATETIVGSEYIVDVPEGETFTNSHDISASEGVTVLVKSGKGTWNTGTRGIGKTTNFARMDVREGTFEVKSYMGNGGFKPPLMVIKPGAMVVSQRGDTYNGNDVTIHIEKGGVFNEDHAQAFRYLKAVTGPGTILNLLNADPGILGNVLADFTGDIIEGRNANTSLAFGDGADAANDPDLTKIGSISMEGGPSADGNYPRFTFRNVAPIVVPGRFGGLGQLTVNAGSSVTFSNLWLTSGANAAVSLQGTVTNVNGRLSLPTNAQLFKIGEGTRYVQIGGVSYGYWPRTGLSHIPYSRLKYPRGSLMGSGAGCVTRILENGAEFWTAYQQPYRSEINSGSSLVFAGGSIQNSCAKSADDPIEFKFDGGTFRFEQDDGSTMSMSYPSGTCPPRFVVGPRGMTMMTHGQGSGSGGIPFVSGVVVTDQGSKGSVNFRGNTTFTFNAPLQIGGTVTLEDGTVAIANQSAYSAADALPPLGTGSVVLVQGRLYSYLPQGTVTRVADGPGAKLYLKGAGVLRAASKTAGLDWQIGPADATACSIVREKGSALFFDAETDDMFLDGKGTCTIGGGLPLGTNGKLPVIPIFVSDTTFTHSHDSSFGEVDFLTYGASGLVRFTDYATAIGDDPTDVVFLNANTTLSSDATVAALHLGGGPGGRTLTIAQGVTLTVGDGTGTACVLTDDCSIKGAGTLNFGTAEGVISSNPRDDTISARIAGSGGLTIVNGYKQDVNGYALILSGDNTYSGGTRISGHRVLVKSDTAFGAGDVWALGGEGAGGQIRFEDTKSHTITNNFHLSGRGRKRGSNNTTGLNFMGAIWALSSAELTGDVEFVGPTRVSVQNQATELTFSGTLSGDSIEFFNYDAALTNAGTVVYAAANTYTGRTDLVRTTLVLEPGATTGTGDVVLDGGELVVKADRSGATLASRLRGSGTVKLDGCRNAPIAFAAHPTDDPFYQAENALDLNDRSRVVNSLAGFTTVTNTGTRAVHLSVLDDAEDSFAGELDPRVTVHYGAVYKPGTILILR